MANIESRPFTLDRVVRLVISCVLFAAVIWLVYRLSGVLLPFCVAALVAYLFEPFVQFNRRLLNLRGRVIAVFVTLFEATMLFGILCYLIVPVLSDEMANMGRLLREYSTSQHTIPFMPEGVHEFIRNNVDFNQLGAMLRTEDQVRMLESFISRSWSMVTSGISMLFSLLSWCIVFLYVIFIMLDYEKLARGFRRMVPPPYRRMVFRIGNDIQRSMNHYFRGQALVAFCVGVMFCIGFMIIGMPMAIILGLFIGLLNMVPYLQLISLVPTTLLCMVCSVDSGIDFWVIFGKCMAVYCIVQAVQDLFLTPKIMGKAMGLNPAIILLSLSIWGSLLGFLGLIIALPLTTLILAYYDEYINMLQLRSGIGSRNGQYSEESDRDSKKI